MTTNTVVRARIDEHIKEVASAVRAFDSERNNHRSHAQGSRQQPQEFQQRWGVNDRSACGRLSRPANSNATTNARQRANIAQRSMPTWSRYW